MSRCVFSVEARGDLVQIHDYIARDSPSAALRFVERLEAQCERLSEHPSMGVSRPEFGAGHRSFVFPGTRYVIIYRPSVEGVEIIHVRHGSVDLLRLFE